MRWNRTSSGGRPGVSRGTQATAWKASGRTSPPNHQLAASAPDEKSFTDINLPILACNVFTLIAGSAGSAWAFDPKTAAALSRNCRRGRDLVCVNVNLLRQLGQRLLALLGSEHYRRLESRTVIPARSLGHQLSCSTAILATVRQKQH